jgi:hypothetical protein
MLTKTSFLSYRHCSKSFWLAARQPDLVASKPPSAFVRKILADGYEVESAFGALVATWPDAGSIKPQVTFATATLLARADFVRTHPNGSIDIFEVKGSTSIKDDHIVDATFQTAIAERAGYKVRDVYVAHLNRSYLRHGDVQLADLLKVEDVTLRVAVARAEIEQQIDAALALLASDSIDERGCDCIYFGNPNERCAGFDYFNAQIPDLSIYLLPRILAPKVRAFVDSGRLALADVRPDELSPLQRPVHRAGVERKPVIDREAIKAFLATIAWPIHFYDYETCNPPIPRSDGYRPCQQAVVQYSLHVLHEGGEVEHGEWLSSGYGEERALVENLVQKVGAAGSAVVWNETFERTCNRELGVLLPEYADFFAQLNDRTVDLMSPFKSHYVDIGFGGSTSIKKILPILCPHIGYDQEAVHDGGGAMEAWTRMTASIDEREKAKLRVDLLAYCQLDTLAMVEIFQFLRKLVA